MSPTPFACCSSADLSAESAIGQDEMAQLRQEFSGDIGVLVELFQQEGPQLFSDMTAAAESRNADALRRAAHALKGCCANFGAKPMESLCQKMESAAQSGDVETAARLLAPVGHELQRIGSALEHASLAPSRP